MTEATIRDALRLADAERIDCLPNKEIFTELAKMGAQVGDLSSHSTKYSSPSLTQNVFANMRKVGKGFSRADTPLFEGMIVAYKVSEGASEVNVEDVPAAGVADEGAASVAVDDVPAAVDEPSIPSLTPPTQPPPPSQDLPSTSQVQPTPPQSLIVQPPSHPQQPQPSHDVEMSMDLLHTLLNTCTTLTRRVEHLEQDKIAQTLVNTSDDTVMDDVSKRGGIIANIDADEDAILKDAKDVVAIEKTGDELKPVEIQEVVEVVTTAKLTTKVVTAASATITAADTLIPAAIITVAAPTLTTAHSVARKRKGVKPQTEAQAKKNMMIYLRNMDGFKMDYFKGMSYDDIYLIFKKKFNSNVAFLEKTKEQMEEEDNKALKRISKSQEDKAAKKQKINEKATPLALKVPVVDYDIYTENNKPYYKIKRADARCISSNLEKSKKCSWFNEGKKLEAVRVLWCADYHIHYNAVDLASREEIFINKARCCEATKQKVEKSSYAKELEAKTTFELKALTEDVMELMNHKKAIKNEPKKVEEMYVWAMVCGLRRKNNITATWSVRSRSWKRMRVSQLHESQLCWCFEVEETNGKCIYVY
uniref:Uncharacterized protein n=1 Tax=Tanacetum cinerariifolium TaxID=118510 RepID=A0A699HD14_TANCI|nr:hypothetical protein [Tanacetum cinerariifolium]